MELRTVRLSELKAAEYNPRVALKAGDREYELLKSSILSNGYIEPIIVNYDMTIISGHQRRRVLMDIGQKAAEVIVVEIKDKQKEKAANIALNKITGLWDDKKLASVLTELDLSGVDLETAGFSKNELSELLSASGLAEEATDDGFGAEEMENLLDKEDTGGIKSGDIITLGSHRILCGDSTDRDLVSKLFDGKKAKLILTDPPYNVGYEDKIENMGGVFGRENHIENDNIDGESFKRFLETAFTAAYEFAENGCPIYVYHSEKEAATFHAAISKAGFKLAQRLIWEKNAFTLGRQDYQWRHEPIYYGWKEGAAHYFINDRTQDTFVYDEKALEDMSREELVKIITDYTDKANTTVIYDPKPQRSPLHPTMKPLTQLGKFILNSSREGDIVFDGFGGSGSTLIACEQLGRRCFMAEVSPVYCNIIKKRYERWINGDE